MKQKKEGMARNKVVRDPTLEERAGHFGEEVSRIGENFGNEMERMGNEIDRSVHSAFGFFWPLLSSVIGLICLALAIWFLNFLSVKTGIAVLSNISNFLAANIGIFFLLFVFFSYMDYLSKANARIRKPISPTINAAGITVAFWVVANVIIISNPSIGIPSVSGWASYLLGRIEWVFLFFAALLYLTLILNTGFEKLREENKMATTRKWGIRKEEPEVRRLYRSGNDKILGGVCGGIAEHLHVDPVIIRLLWVAGTFLWGAGLILYIIFWIIVPRNPNHKWK